MKKSLFMFLMIVLTAFLLVSCSRVQDTGELKEVKLEKLDGIPAEYGALVGITANPQAHEWAQLWFQDDSGTIRVVSVGFFDQKVLENVTVIPRN